MKKLLSVLTVLVIVVAATLYAFPSITAIALENKMAVANGGELLTAEQQALENIAIEKYNKLLQIWARDRSVIDDVDANFPSFYGGAYVNGEKELVIQVTALNDSIEMYFANIIDLTNVRFEVVKYSFDELKEAHAEIVGKMDVASEDALLSGISGVGISFQNNAVTLYLDIQDSRTKSDSLKKEVQSKLSEFENIIIRVTEKPASCATVEPGSAFGDRSVGFWATDGEGNLGIVTAPHDDYLAGDTLYLDGQTFGTAGTPYFSGNVDAVFVRRTNVNSFTPTRYISGWGFSLGRNGYIVLPVGATVYSKGKTTGCQSGVITEINHTVQYTNATLYDCVLTTATCDSGDSGGIVCGGGTTELRNIAGIITGKHGSNMMYIKASNIVSTLGISIY